MKVTILPWFRTRINSGFAADYGWRDVGVGRRGYHRLRGKLLRRFLRKGRGLGRRQEGGQWSLVVVCQLQARGIGKYLRGRREWNIGMKV